AEADVAAVILTDRKGRHLAARSGRAVFTDQTADRTAGQGCPALRQARMPTTTCHNAALTPGLSLTKKALMSASRFKYERELLARGVVRIAGVDEAGLGPLAGPVVAAAAVLPVEWLQGRLPRSLQGLNDSKQLTPEQRESFFGFLTNHPAVQ